VNDQNLALPYFDGLEFEMGQLFGPLGAWRLFAFRADPCITPKKLGGCGMAKIDEAPTDDETISSREVRKRAIGGGARPRWMQREN
jgi:hypothetical protein